MGKDFTYIEEIETQRADTYYDENNERRSETGCDKFGKPLTMS